jgi:hypothetical protein
VVAEAAVAATEAPVAKVAEPVVQAFATTFAFAALALYA